MSDSVPESAKSILRSEVGAKIEALLAGQLGPSALAAWAFDRFYAEELGSEAYEEGAEEILAEALDALMFCDDPGFGLSEAELRTLVTQLQ